MPRLLLIAGLLVALGAAGCRRAPTPGGATGSKPDQARKQAETLAANAVKHAAEAQAHAIPSLAKGGGGGGIFENVVVAGAGAATSKVNAVPPVDPAPPAPTAPTVPASSGSKDKEPPQPKALPRPGSPAIIKDRVVSSIPYASEVEAEDDATNVACDIIQKRLAELDPPVKYRPSANEVKNEFARRDSRTVRPPPPAEKELYEKNNLGKNLVYVEFDVEVTADQIRELRTRDRVAGTLRILGALTAVALAGFLFLRLDEWTKGYLTRWLAIAAVLLAGGAAAALYFV